MYFNLYLSGTAIASKSKIFSDILLSFFLVFFPFPLYESWGDFFKDFTAGRDIVFFLNGYIHSWLLVFYSHCLDHQRGTGSTTSTILTSKWPSHKFLFNCLSWLGMSARGLLHIDVHKQMPTVTVSQSSNEKWIFFDDALSLARILHLPFQELSAVHPAQLSSEDIPLGKCWSH